MLNHDLLKFTTCRFFNSMIVNVAPMRINTEAINIDIVGLSCKLFRSFKGDTHVRLSCAPIPHKGDARFVIPAKYKAGSP